MTRKQITLLVFTLTFLYACNQQGVKEQKFTGINTLSYTDVAYLGKKDTAIVATYSGRIAKRINNSNKEIIIKQLDDEIYAVKYIKSKNEVVASTMTQGIVIVDANNGNIKKKLSVGKTWINNLQLSDDGKYLMGYNGQNQNFIWDVLANYKLLNYPENFPKSLVRFSENGKIYHSTKNTLVTWNLKNNNIKSSKKSKGTPLDIDKNENLILLNYDEFSVTSKDSIVAYTKKHPNWPFYYKPQDKIIRIPLQMKLTALCFANNTICSGGIDRSIRFWDTKTGKLKNELLKHRATISAIAVSEDKQQIVSVDLKGGIQFTDINL